MCFGANSYFGVTTNCKHPALNKGLLFLGERDFSYEVSQVRLQQAVNCVQPRCDRLLVSELQLVLQTFVIICS